VTLLSAGMAVSSMCKKMLLLLLKASLLQKSIASKKETDTHYVYILKMSDEAKVSHMTKVWNAPWAMKELGWMS